MNTLRWVIAIGCFVASIAAASGVLAETPAERLTRLSIKFTQDDDGKIVAVELPERNVDATIEAIIDIPTIQSVKAVDCRASIDGFHLLGKMPALRALDLEGSLKPDEHAQWLAQLPALESVSITDCRLTNTGLVNVCKSLPKLKELDISNTAVTPQAGVHVISDELRELESLTIRLSYVTYSLGEGSVQLHTLARLPGLKRLRANGFPIKSDELYAFGCCRHLEELSIEPYTIEGDVAPLVYVHNCKPSLGLLPLVSTRLGIGLSQYQGEIWLRAHHAVLIKFPRQDLADVTKCDIGQAPDLRVLEQMPKLTVLRILQPRFDSDELIRLRSASNLAEVHIAYATIDRATVELLLETKSLKRIGFDSCKFNDAAASLIRQHYPAGRIVVNSRVTREALRLHDPPPDQSITIPIP